MRGLEQLLQRARAAVAARLEKGCPIGPATALCIIDDYIKEVMGQHEKRSVAEEATAYAKAEAAGHGQAASK